MAFDEEEWDKTAKQEDVAGITLYASEAIKEWIQVIEDIQSAFIFLAY